VGQLGWLQRMGLDPLQERAADRLVWGPRFLLLLSLLVLFLKQLCVLLSRIEISSLMYLLLHLMLLVPLV
jgi:hypothetical protein